MGWKGNLRTLNSTIKKIDREAKRRQRELEKQHKEFEKMEALEQARYEVDVYENYIDRIQSLHKDSEEEIIWNDILTENPPVKPVQEYLKMNKAKDELNKFKPSFFTKLFGNAEKKRKRLNDEINNSKIIDEQEYDSSIREYEKEYEIWSEKISLAKMVLEDDESSMLKVIEDFGIFSEIEDIGSHLKFNFEEGKLCIDIIVRSSEIIPKEKKSLLASGKLSVKNLPKGQYYEIYQDYVCSSILRIARETFALLPIELVIITAKDNILNKKTGHKEILPVISVLISRNTLNSLNLDAIDPSDSLDNFIHNMSFKKTMGFSPVEIVRV